MDSDLAFMYLLLDKAKEVNKHIVKEELLNYGKTIKFHKGVDTWFDRVNQYAELKGLCIDHYVISNGLAEIIEGSSIAKYLTAIFANQYMYNIEERAVWPALSVNYINKSQFLWRVNKGVVDINRQKGVSKYIATSNTAVPFSNIVFLGDVLSDVPLFKTMNAFGGNTIGVYDTALNSSLSRSLEEANQITYASLKDFLEDGETEKTVKLLLDKIALEGKIED